MLANIPLPHSDQTIESYVANIFLASSQSNWKCMMKEYFGRPTIKLGKNYFTGLDHFMSTPAGQQFLNNEELIQKHTFTALFIPFLPEDKRADLFKRLTEKYLGGLNNTLGINSTPVIRNELWFCPHCIKEEIQSLGYAYAHRTHQIIGVNVCPTHGDLLGPLEDNNPQLLSFRGIIRATNNAFPKVITKPALLTAHNPQYSAITTFGLWVNAIFSNQLPYLSPSQRTQLVTDRLSNIPKKPNEPKSHPARLERLLTDKYGKEFLQQMGLSIVDGITEHWPALFIWGNAYRNHPIANLLILNALFEKPEQYKKLAEMLPVMAQTEEHNPHEMLRPIKFKLTRQLIRDLLSRQSIKEVARANSVGEEEISRFLKVKNAIAIRREDAILNTTKRKYRKQARDLKAENPSMNRTTLNKKARTCFKWLMKNDREWLEGEFPLFYKPKKQPTFNTFQNAHVDAYAVDQIDQAWKSLIGNQEPRRISGKLILEQIQTASIHKKLKRGELPQASNRIKQIAETQQAYQERTFKLIAKHASLGKKTDALAVAQELIHHYHKLPWLLSDLLNLLLDTPPLRTSDLEAVTPNI